MDPQDSIARLMGDITGAALYYLGTTALKDKAVDEQVLWVIHFLKTHSDMQIMMRDELLLFISLLIYKVSEAKLIHD